jgi:hypothetical protein
MPITVFIRYTLDPFKRAQFERYAERWLSIFRIAAGPSSATGCRTRARTTSSTG